MPERQPPDPALASGASRNVSLSARVRYWFDLLLARGTWPVLVLVASATVLVILISALILTVSEVAFTPGADESAGEAFWQSMLRVIDPGTMASDSGWGPRALALIVTLSGILLAGTLIGAIAAGIEERLDGLRRGRSVVVESGHVVILGWSARLFVVVEELAIAPSRRTIVVLADRDKTEMEESIRARVDLHGRRLVCRSGEPSNLRDLSMVSIESARSIIVLGDESKDADAHVATRVLAANLKLDSSSSVPIVAEFEDERTATVLIKATGNRVHPVIASVAAPRIAAVALRSRGHSQVLGELVTFSGSELYVTELPELEGREFIDLVGSFEHCSPIGLVTAEDRVELSPSPDRRIQPGERVAVIAPERSAITWSPAENAPSVRSPRKRATPARRRILIIGWNRHAGMMLSELDRVSSVGSSVAVVVNSGFVDEGDIALPETNALTIEVHATREPRDYISRFDSQSFDNVVVLGYRDSMNDARADGWTLMTLLWLDDNFAGAGVRPRIVVELLDASHVELARLSGADDYVISDALLSQIMAQLADQPERREILRSVFGDSGPSLSVEPVASLGLSGRLSYGGIERLGYEQGVLVIGMRLPGPSGPRVLLNPPRSMSFDLGREDAVVAIS